MWGVSHVEADRALLVESTPELDVVDLGPTRNLMEYDIDLAERTMRLHDEAPDRPCCSICGAAYPCRWARWGRIVLKGAGWSDAEIDTAYRPLPGAKI